MYVISRVVNRTETLGERVKNVTFLTILGQLLGQFLLKDQALGCWVGCCGALAEASLSANNCLERNAS